MSSDSSTSSDESSFSSALEMKPTKGAKSKLKMPENDDEEDVFETSDIQTETDMDDDIEKSRATVNSSMSSSKEMEAVWANLPDETKDLCNQAIGILYMERYESFIRNDWPYDVKRGNLCHPRALALAGLAFHSLKPAPSAQCVVCLKIFENLEKNSNPWILHSELNPDCYIVQLGQRDETDDYTMDEIMEMIFKKIYNQSRKRYEEKEKTLKKQVFALRKRELDLGLKSEEEPQS